MAQAARTAGRTAVGNRTPRQYAIARRIAARRAVASTASKVVLQDPAMIDACIEAAGFEEHRAY
jgi:hypothetical protein